jgi:hypothetical protein
MKSLFRSYDLTIESAYVISLPNNKTSQQLTERCIGSCKKVGVQAKVWEGYDGTSPEEIKTPAHLENCSFMPMLKLTNHYITRAEVACALSHISLWAHCAKIDRPVVILEHDAIMLQPITNFNGFNTVMYLGGEEWTKKKWPIMHVPPYGSDGPNKYFICRAHAYAIDPIVAKNMLSNVLKMGIYASADVLISSDLYNISHNGPVAYDEPAETTIKNRPPEGQKRVDRNDNLSV